MSRDPLRKDKLRHESMAVKGPLWVPNSVKEKLKNDGYKLKWVGVSERDTYTITTYESVGYEKVKYEEIEDKQMGESNLSRVYGEGAYVCTGTGPGTKAYLMKLPLDVYEELEEIHEENIQERQSRLTAIKNTEGVYGDIEFNSKN